MSVMLLEEVHPSLTFYFSVKSLTAAGKFKNRRYRENNQKKTVSPISETLLNTSYDCAHYLCAAGSHYFYCHCSWLCPPSLPGLTAHRQLRNFYDWYKILLKTFVKYLPAILTLAHLLSGPGPHHQHGETQVRGQRRAGGDRDGVHDQAGDGHTALKVSTKFCGL